MSGRDKEHEDEVRLLVSPGSLKDLFKGSRSPSLLLSLNIMIIVVFGGVVVNFTLAVR